MLIKFLSLKIIFAFILISVFILPNFQGLIINTSNVFAQAGEQQALESELEELLKQIAQYEANINKTEKEKQTLRNQITILRNRIGKLDAQVRQGNIVIKDLDVQIQDTEISIEETSSKIEESRKRLAAILRAINRENQYSFTEVFLAGNTLSDFFNNLTALETLNIENKRILGEIESLKVFLGGQKDVAEGKKQTTRNVVAVQILQKEEGVRIRREQERLHRMTEAEYQQYLKEKADAEKRVTEIRAKIIQLVGVLDEKQPNLGEALKIAEWVQQQTGVQPAFLLAIIIQESALGRNVGQCFIADTTTGNTRDRFGNFFNHGRGIRGDRDLSLFLEIAKEIGVNNDPFQTPMSCFIKGNGCARRNHLGRLVFSNASVSSQGLVCPKGFYFFGFGGAIGPAQFLPSTWTTVRDEASTILNRTANPWRIKDSFLGSAIYLRKQGALICEKSAAARYFGAAGLGYESRVMRTRHCLQKFINEDRMTLECQSLIFHFQ